MPPKLATPHIVLAAEPPLISTAGPERLVQVHGPLGVDQRHRALDELVLVEERVVGVGDHVDEGVADADDVVASGMPRGTLRRDARPASGARPSRAPVRCASRP